MRLACPASCLCSAFLLTILLHSVLAQEETEDDWPVEIKITAPNSTVVQRPVALVAGFGTTIYVATTSGQLFIADVKTGVVDLINHGGDDQRFGGLCLDSRGPGTLYATGRDSGIVYAFNRRGELLQKYQIVANAVLGGNSFLTGCIQTEYQLIITDSYNLSAYYLPLTDEGPLRGHPPELIPDIDFQGKEITLAGEWQEIDAPFNAYGVEWTAKHNKTAYILNSASGQLYTCSIKESGINGTMFPVIVIGSMKLFPGGLQILFDSRNENILYITMPHLNAIAVLEFASLAPRRAKFIRMVTSSLLNGPLAISEYGDFIYPVNGMFSASAASTPTFSLIKLSRHQQMFDSGNPDQQFTTAFDNVEQPALPTVKPISEIVAQLREAPAAIGTSAPAAIGTASAPVPSPSFSSDNGATSSPGGDPNPSDPIGPSGSSSSSIRPSSIFAINDVDTNTETGSCFPASATVEVQGRGVVRMEEVDIGDRVLVGIDENGRRLFSDVFLFSHRDGEISSWFVRIYTSDQQVLEITAGHYLYVNGTLSTASKVRIGDNLDCSRGHPVQVVRMEQVRRRGLFNPQTIQGDIVVNDVRTSTYTSAVEPVIAGALLAPFRGLYRCNREWSRGIGTWFRIGGRGAESFLPGGLSSYT